MNLTKMLANIYNMDQMLVIVFMTHEDAKNHRLPDQLEINCSFSHFPSKKYQTSMIFAVK